MCAEQAKQRRKDLEMMLEGRSKDEDTETTTAGPERKHGVAPAVAEEDMLTFDAHQDGVVGLPSFDTTVDGIASDPAAEGAMADASSALNQENPEQGSRPVNEDLSAYPTNAGVTVNDQAIPGEEKMVTD